MYDYLLMSDYLFISLCYLFTCLFFFLSEQIRPMMALVQKRANSGISLSVFFFLPFLISCEYTAQPFKSFSTGSETCVFTQLRWRKHFSYKQSTMKFCIRQVLIAIGAILFLTFIIQSYNNSSYLRWNASEIAPNSLKSDSQCTAALKVAFMKNHKCASTTIENIMYR